MVGYTLVTILIKSVHTEGSGSTLALQSFTFQMTEKTLKETVSLNANNIEKGG